MLFKKKLISNQTKKTIGEIIIIVNVKSLI